MHRPECTRSTGSPPTIRTLVPAGELIGVECDAHFFSPRAYFALDRGLPANRLVDSAELVNWVRVVKSPHEVQQLRIAGTIVERAMRTACDSVRPGRRQCDVVAEIMAAQATGTPEHGGDYPAIVPMLPTGEAAGAPHLTWTDRPFKTGEATTIELAGAFGRYHAPLARTVMLGEPPTPAHRNREGDRRGHGRDAGRDPARRRRRTRCTRRSTGSSDHMGMEKGSRLGYSIGIGYPPDWGERTISLRPGETTELAAGMALHIIPGMWTDGFGYEMSEPVVVTDTGVERLTDLPQELTVWR